MFQLNFLMALPISFMIRSCPVLGCLTPDPVFAYGQFGGSFPGAVLYIGLEFPESLVRITSTSAFSTSALMI